MTDKNRSKEDLLRELKQLRDRVAKLEAGTVAPPDGAISEAAWKRLVRAAPVGIFVSQDSNFVFTNPMMTELTDYSSEELRSKKLWDLVHPEMRELVKQKALARGRGEAVEQRYVIRCQKKAGDSVWIDYFAETVEIDGKPAILGTAVDITAHREAREALSKSEERYRSLVDSLPVGIFQATPEGKVVSANPALVRMYGCDSVEEYLALPDRDSFSDPSKRDKIVSILREKGRISDYEVQMRRKDGSYFWISLSAYVVLDESGAVSHYDGIEADITERKLATDALKQSGKTMSALLNAPTQTLFLMDIQGILLSLNEAMAERLGRSVEELIGTCVHDYIPAPLVESRKAKELEVIESGKPVEYVDEYEGNWREIRLYPVFDNRGTVEAIAVYSMDVTERKRAETERERAREFMQTLIDGFPESVMVINRDYTVALANRRIREMAGGQDPVAACLKCHQVSHKSATPCDGTKEPCPLKQVVATKVPVTVEHIHYDAEDHAIAFEIIAAPIFDEAGEVVQIIESARDITERKRAEEALNKHKEELQIILDSVPAMIFFKDKDNRFIRINNALAKASQLPRDQIEGKTAFEVYPDQAEEYWRDDMEVIESGIPKLNIVEPIVAGQETRWVQTDKLPYRDSAGNIIGIIGFAQDITELKRAEEALKESEDKFRRIAERSFDAIFVTDMEGRLTYVSPAAETLLGYRPEEMVGRNVSEFVREASLKDIGQGFAEVSQGRAVEGQQFEVIGSDGETVYVEANSTPIIQDGRVVGNQAIVRDISERRRAEEMLKQTYDEQSRQLRQVAGGLAHDIYNDLFPVAAGIHKLRRRLLDSNQPVEERNRKLLDLMDSAVRRAIDLTESVNLYSRLDRSEIDAGANLASTINDVANQNRDRVSELAISLEIHVPDTIDVACSRIQVFHLFNNLLLNAIDAVKDSAIKLIRISATQDDRQVRIEFEDSGHGVSPETLPRMFEPFFSTRPKTNSGLGLAIVRRIVDLSGGEINVHSVLDKGTAFTIILPGNVSTQK